MDTLLLTRSEVAALLEPAALLAVLRGAFAAYSTRRAVDAMRVPVSLPSGKRRPGRRACCSPPA